MPDTLSAGVLKGTTFDAKLKISLFLTSIGTEAYRSHCESPSADSGSTHTLKLNLIKSMLLKSIRSVLFLSLDGVDILKASCLSNER